MERQKGCKLERSNAGFNHSAAAAINGALWVGGVFHVFIYVLGFQGAGGEDKEQFKDVCVLGAFTGGSVGVYQDG